MSKHTFPYCLSLLAALLALSGCSTYVLEKNRAHYGSEKSQQKIQKSADARSQQISNGTTFYGKKLECLSEIHKDFFMAQRAAVAQSGQGGREGWFRMAVAPMRDKTGKVFDINSTVLSDMVMDSLAHFKYFDVVETPLSPDQLSDSRNNFLDPRYLMPAGVIQNFASTMTTLQHLPVGVIFPSNYYISGAITQYDETNVVPSTRDIGIDLNQFQYKYNTQAISATVNLRLVDSWTGSVVRVAESNELASVSLSNTFYSVKTGSNFFRLIGTKDYGIDYSVEVGDPKTAAVKEMIDKGVYQLLDKFLQPYKTREMEC